jgi:hypothetical protein
MTQAEHAAFKVDGRVFVELDPLIGQATGLTHGTILTQMLTADGQIVITKKEEGRF